MRKGFLTFFGIIVEFKLLIDILRIIVFVRLFGLFLPEIKFFFDFLIVIAFFGPVRTSPENILIVFLLYRLS